MLSPAEERPHGTRLTADGLYAPGHQHFFVARLHMDVDGGNNTLHEISVQRDPRDASANAFGGAFRRVERELRDSAAARRRCDPAASRHWEVRSAERNRAGGACGWRLVPGRNVVPLAAADAVYRRRARFLDYHLWATPHDPAQRFPGGEFPNQNPRDGPGLPEWAASGRSLPGEAIVLWYCFGVTHFPRLEDWPVMPAEAAGFALEPAGFFDRSPAVATPLRRESAKL